MNDLILLVLQIIILVASYYIGKEMSQDQKNSAIKNLELISKYADALVVWAREFMKDTPGEAKMEAVVEQLLKICDDNSIVMNITELKAIAQKAYESMKTK